MFHGDIMPRLHTRAKLLDNARNWVLGADKTRDAVERLTRKDVGTPEWPIPGLPHGTKVTV